MNLALYREFRPKNFDELIGQDFIVKTLKNPFFKILLLIYASIVEMQRVVSSNTSKRTLTVSSAYNGNVANYVATKK